MKVQQAAKQLNTIISQGGAGFELEVFHWGNSHGREPVTELLVNESTDTVEIYTSTCEYNPNWVRANVGDGYECSTAGDQRFSALVATMPDGRTIEQWYQCDIKGYDIGGTNWKLGKGKPPVIDWSETQLKDHYLHLWELWAIHNLDLMAELNDKATKHGNKLSDQFARTSINQAVALAEILNNWFR